MPAGIALLIISLALALSGALSAEADPGTPGTPGTEPTGFTSCTDLGRHYADQLPTGWILECRTEFPPEWQIAAGPVRASAMTNRVERRIVVLEGQDADYTEASIAHELAHAESTGWPPELRIAFSHAVGADTWAGDGGESSPVEVFAESSVRCRGLATNIAYPLVPCELVEAARTAGGASGALPSGSALTR